MTRMDGMRGRVAGWLYGLGYRIQAPERGIPCVDCGFLRPADEEDCPVCVAGWEEQQREKSIYGAGYEDALREVEQQEGPA